jgi:hypothetical protein
VLFTVLLAGQDQAAFTIYYVVLQNRDADRRRAFTEIATAKGISEETLQEFKTISDDIKPWSDRRNEVVHGHWASIEGKPDSIFAAQSLLDWATVVDATITVNLARARGETTYVPPQGISPITRFWEFTVADLDEIVAETLALIPRVEALQRTIASQVFLRHPQEQLRKAENILRHLHLRQSPQNAGEVQPPDQPPDQH